MPHSTTDVTSKQSAGVGPIAADLFARVLTLLVCRSRRPADPQVYLHPWRHGRPAQVPAKILHHLTHAAWPAAAGLGRRRARQCPSRNDGPARPRCRYPASPYRRRMRALLAQKRPRCRLGIARGLYAIGHGPVLRDLPCLNGVVVIARIKPAYVDELGARRLYVSGLVHSAALR